MKRFFVGVVFVVCCVCCIAQTEAEWVEEKISGMTLEEKIGQLIVYKFQPINTAENLQLVKDVIEQYHIGGVLFSGGQLMEQAKLTNYAQELSDIQLLVTFDGEWGLAMRLKTTTPTFPRNRVLGTVCDDNLIYAYGREVARECRELGVHVNFAPVADVDTNPKNPVIGSRSFGRDATDVARKVVAYSRGLEDGGVIAVAKHFPGHGDTSVDSHKALPVLNFGRDRLNRIELVPFKAAIQSGINGIMVGHLLVPSISNKTASISPEVNRLLVDGLGFRGLVFTDALEMKGVSDNPDVCAQAIMAGNDLLLAPSDIKGEMDGVLRAVGEGRISERLIDEKCRKVLGYKYRLGLVNRQRINLEGLSERINSTEALQLVSRLKQASEQGKALLRIDSIAKAGIAAKAFPGCQILALHKGEVIYDKCFGTTDYSATESVTHRHLYDLASLTKTTATLLAVMKLYEEQRFSLKDEIGKYVPQMQGSNKEHITIEQLLYHQSGLQPSVDVAWRVIDPQSYDRPFVRKPDANHKLRVGNRLWACTSFKFHPDKVHTIYSNEFRVQVADHMYVDTHFKDTILQMIAHEVPLRSKTYRYSCLNFVLLQQMVEQLTGQPLDKYLSEHFYEPMGLRRLTFRPLRKFATKEVVPTIAEDYLRQMPLRGYVHDELAAFMGGVSGNAGLFGNAADVAAVYQMLLQGGQWQGKQYLKEETVKFFLSSKSPSCRRALGFDKPDKKNPRLSPCCTDAPASVVGHTGFTGTCVWADPANELVYVFLSNRTYPRPFDHKKLQQMDIRSRIQHILYGALKKKPQK